MTGRPLLPTLILLAAALALASCGEREFAPAEFVEEANREGAAITLGEPLYSPEEGIEVYGLSFEGAETRDAEHAGGGSLAIAADADAARTEFERCESSVTLRCYRAANVVLYLEGEPGDRRLARVEGAIRALESD